MCLPNYNIHLLCWGFLPIIDNLGVLHVLYLLGSVHYLHDDLGWWQRRGVYLHINPVAVHFGQ